MSSHVSYWSDAEDKALQGLSLEAQIIYLRGIRRYANKDGIAGVERRINRASLSEVCHFLPDVGSTKQDTRPTWEQVRRRLKELERAGLIIQKPNLIFELVLVGQDKSVQNRTTPMSTPMMTPPKPNDTNGLNGYDDTHDDTHDDTTSLYIKKEKENELKTVEKLTSYQPKDGQFKMHFDFKPTNNFYTLLTFAGIDSSKFDDQILKDFIIENEASDLFKTQKQWEVWLKNFYQRALLKKAKPTYQRTGFSKREDEPKMNIPEFVPQKSSFVAPTQKTKALSALFD